MASHRRETNRAKKLIPAAAAGIVLGAALAIVPVGGVDRLADAMPDTPAATSTTTTSAAWPGAVPVPLGAAAAAIDGETKSRPTVGVALANWAGRGDVLAVSDGGVVLLGVPADPRGSQLVEVDGATFRRWSWGETRDPRSLADGRAVAPVVVVVGNLRSPHPFIVAGMVTQ